MINQKTPKNRKFRFKLTVEAKKTLCSAVAAFGVLMLLCFNGFSATSDNDDAEINSDIEKISETTVVTDHSYIITTTNPIVTTVETTTATTTITTTTPIVVTTEIITTVITEPIIPVTEPIIIEEVIEPPVVEPISEEPIVEEIQQDIPDLSQGQIFEATYYMDFTSPYVGASGNGLVSGYSVASNLYPFNSILYIYDIGDTDYVVDGYYRVDDCGGMANNVLDMYYWNYTSGYNEGQLRPEFKNAGRVNVGVVLIE